MRKLAAGLGSGFSFGDATSYWRWVDMCEAEGADSLWHSDRLTGAVPTLECLSALAAIAGRTRRIKFGTNVLSIAMRDPVLVAKQCATIDVLSQGRLLPAFGIGGKTSEDWQALGLDFTGSGARADEAIEIVARLWAGESLTFNGRHFHLTSATIRPLPAQPDLPLWIGGSSAAAIRRTARFGTGWQGGLESQTQVGTVVRAIADGARALGRSIDSDHYGMTILYRLGHAKDTATQNAFAALKARFKSDISHLAVTGDASDILARLADYVTAGVSKFVMVPAAADAEDLIDQTRRLLKEVAPRVPALPQ